MSYKDRLLSLNMLPLAYDREIKDLLSFYKVIHAYIVMDVSNCVTFNNHPTTRRGRTAGC